MEISKSVDYCLWLGIQQAIIDCRIITNPKRKQESFDVVTEAMEFFRKHCDESPTLEEKYAVLKTVMEERAASPEPAA